MCVWCAWMAWAVALAIARVSLHVHMVRAVGGDYI